MSERRRHPTRCSDSRVASCATIQRSLRTERRRIGEVRHRPPAIAVIGIAGLFVAAALFETVIDSPPSRASGPGSPAVRGPAQSPASTNPPPSTTPTNAHPVLPTTPVGSLPILGSTTTAQIDTFTHPRTGIWMTPKGLTLTLAGYLNDYGLATFPSTYGGDMVSGDGITIFLTTLDGTTEAAFRSVTPAGTLNFVSTPHTWAFVSALRDVVQNSWTAVRARGVDLVGFGPSVQTGTVTLRVENPTPQDTAILDTMFGAGNITITTGHPATFV